MIATRLIYQNYNERARSIPKACICIIKSEYYPIWLYYSSENKDVNYLHSQFPFCRKNAASKVPIVCTCTYIEE